jgi:arylsulfatase A-like enzyme
MTGRNSLLSKRIPIPSGLKRFFGDDTVRIRRAAALIGLMEGVAVSRYEIVQGDLGFVPLLTAVGFVAANTVISLVLWLLFGTLIGRFLKREEWVFRLCFTIWAAVVAVGRHLLEDRTVDWGWNCWLAGLALIYLSPLHRSGRPFGVLNLAAEVGAVILVTCFSLLGRIPDYSFPPGQTYFLLLSSAIIAGVIYAAAVRVQPVLAAGVALLLLLGLLPIAAGAKLEKPNVLFVLVDTLRQDHVSVNDDKVQSPSMERLAEQGTNFTDAVTVIPKTTSSVASIFTGRYPIHHGVRTLYSRLALEQPTLAEEMYRNGYRTAAFVNNAWLSRGRGFAQGFEQFHDHYRIEGAYGPFKYVSWVVLLDQLLGERIEPFTGQTWARELTDAALDHLEQVRDESFFVYLHYFEPHWPYFPPDELARRYKAPKDGKCIVNYNEQAGVDRGLMIFQNYLPERENEAARRLYKGECDDNLAEVGRLIEGLDALGLAEDTIVIVTSDHGHSLGEHDYYFHHGEFLYDVSVEIPLIMRWPGHLPAGAEVDRQVRTIDLAPTIYQLAGITPEDRLDGGSLLGIVTGDEEGHREAFLESDVNMFPANNRRALAGISGKLRALRTKTHKVILNPTHKGSRFELYDLAGDPAETENLAADPEHAELLDRLKRRLMAYFPKRELKMLTHMGSGLVPGKQLQDLDPNELEMLRNLGYIQ